MIPAGSTAKAYTAAAAVRLHELGLLDLDAPTLKESLSGFRKWGFEATEPHIFEYYDVDIATELEKGGFAAIDERPNDPYNHGWFGMKPHTV